MYDLNLIHLLWKSFKNDKNIDKKVNAQQILENPKKLSTYVTCQNSCLDIYIKTQFYKGKK